MSIDGAKATIDHWAESGLLGADSAAFYKGEVDKLNAAIKRQPARSTTVVTAFNAVQAREQIDRVRFSAQSLDGKVYTVRLKTIYETVQKGATSGPGFKFHEGGIVPGRRGEEIAAVLQAGEEVLSLDSPRNSGNVSRRFAGVGAGGMGGSTFIFQIDARGAWMPDTDAVERKLGKHVDAAMRNGYITSVAAR